MRYYAQWESMAVFNTVSFHAWTRGMWRKYLRDHKQEESLNRKLAAMKRWMWANNIREYRYRVKD